MPELPEVETVARQLRPLLIGRRVVAAQVLDADKLGGCGVEACAGHTIEGVRRLGKQIVVDLGELHLGVHLRMTGRLRVLDQGELPRHSRALLDLSDGASLVFADTRRFGTLQVASDPLAFAPAGLDPTTPRFTPALLLDLLRRGRGTTPLKPWLLRQDRLVGIGNIYASEICFEAALHPQRPVARLGPVTVRRLHDATRDVLEAAIEHGGTTFSDFQGATGETGGHQAHLCVYGREGEACVRCGGTVERVVQAQRATYFCGGCQRR